MNVAESRSSRYLAVTSENSQYTGFYSYFDSLNPSLRPLKLHLPAFLAILFPPKSRKKGENDCDSQCGFRHVRVLHLLW